MTQHDIGIGIGVVIFSRTLFYHEANMVAKREF